MQPYIFPYIGYFNLIASVDKMVIYDDVNFIKQGWINRNSILLNGKSFLFTVPLKNVSSFKLIKDTFIDETSYEIWKKKLLITLTQAYKKAPFYNDVFHFITAFFAEKKNNIGDLARLSVTESCKFLNINTNFIESSSIYKNDYLKGEERVIDICVKEGATKYNNAAGGRNLYFRENFLEHGIELRFIQPEIAKYEQFAPVFVSKLSIIDIMMFNSRDNIRKMLHNYVEVRE